jgi:NAD(P)-dependent dehydrogenase (short-subunit alcohol dehydrogenase family)
VREDALRERALLVGNSDGMGLEMTRRLLAEGWEVIGLSKSESPLAAADYRHVVADVGGKEYVGVLERVVGDVPPDLCVYFAGIGELLDLADMSAEARIIDVNLTGMVRTASVVIPLMVGRGRGHLMGLSSLADELLSPVAPSYHASKAGFSNYLESLALALKGTGVRVTNVRFGFVDTKMAKGAVKPLMMSVEKAVDHLQRCIKDRPVRYTAPRAAVPLIKLRKLMMRLKP